MDFSLSVECGAQKNAAEQLASHFADSVWALSNGRESSCRVDLFQDIEDNWWCRVCPSQTSEIGVNAPEAAYLMTELGILLYQRLRTAPAFRYGLVGIEVDEFRTYSELLEEEIVAIPGLVVASPIGRELGQADKFQNFSPGYIWQPYAGEVYKPLIASRDLKEKLNELLVA
ncbi:MAG: hypothetical protein HC824_07815 [Synechococcales cyanobacterium RM1_1_8]|nr:hypothetical protein [Synechococcales cyanobacterium RM1_1_8]